MSATLACGHQQRCGVPPVVDPDGARGAVQPSLGYGIAACAACRALPCARPGVTPCEGSLLPQRMQSMDWMDREEAQNGSLPLCPEEPVVVPVLLDAMLLVQPPEGGGPESLPRSNGKVLLPCVQTKGLAVCCPHLLCWKKGKQPTARLRPSRRLCCVRGLTGDHHWLSLQPTMLQDAPVEEVRREALQASPQGCGLCVT